MKTKLMIATALLLSGLNSFAGTSDTLLLKGTVPGIVDIKVNANAAASTLDIVGGASALEVALVDEKCNRKAGYTVSMSSINGGKLVHSTDSSQSVAYQLSYNGATAATPETTASTVKTVSSLTGLTTNQSSVKITFTAAPNAIEGLYQDTVTFSIAAN